MTAASMLETLLCRTPHGRAAADAPALPAPYRAVLKALDELDGVICADELAGRVPQLLPEQLEAVLADLDAIGLVETVPMDWLVELYLLDGAASAPR
jgi:hypothetical protein